MKFNSFHSNRTTGTALVILQEVVSRIWKKLHREWPELLRSPVLIIQRFLYLRGLLTLLKSSSRKRLLRRSTVTWPVVKQMSRHSGTRVPGWLETNLRTPRLSYSIMYKTKFGDSNTFKDVSLSFDYFMRWLLRPSFVREYMYRWPSQFTIFGTSSLKQT